MPGQGLVEPVGLVERKRQRVLELAAARLVQVGVRPFTHGQQQAHRLVGAPCLAQLPGHGQGEAHHEVGAAGLAGELITIQRRVQ